MLSKEEIWEKHVNKPIGYTESAMLAMEDYANQKAIQFAEWLNSEGYREYDGYDRWIAPHNNNNVYETPELFNEFSKSKQ